MSTSKDSPSHSLVQVLLSLVAICVYRQHSAMIAPLSLVIHSYSCNLVLTMYKCILISCFMECCFPLYRVMRMWIRHRGFGMRHCVRADLKRCRRSVFSKCKRAVMVIRACFPHARCLAVIWMLGKCEASFDLSLRNYEVRRYTSRRGSIIVRVDIAILQVQSPKI